jgi:serine/threonine protein kinase
MRAPASCKVASFGPFELDLKAGELRRNGRAILLQEQSFLVLKLLLERPGELVTRDEMRRTLWPNNTIVDFNQSINAVIKKLRQALDDSPETPKYVETIARRGYRLLVPVDWREPSPAPSPEPVVQPAEPPRYPGHLIGKKILHYRVLQVLGGGGMGVIYAAEDIKLGRRVALKFLPEELAGDAIAMQRFLREARAASALNHPNICTIFAVEEYEGQPFIAMELLEGRTLREVITESETAAVGIEAGLQLANLLEIGTQVARGLEAAHQAGIVHRDIKPANIFVTNQSQVKILDFGLAILHTIETPPEGAPGQPGEASGLDPLLTLTRTGVTVGTAAYMSPEQVRGEKLDARTDLFSFGLVLYELATGKRAFAGDTAAVLHDAILNDTPPAIRVLNPAVPSRLEGIVYKAVQKDREARYQTALEIRADLEKMQREKWRTSRWWWIAGFGVFALVVLASLWFQERERPFTLPLSDVKLTQLTSNSSENRINEGMISPDGRFLVYTDPTGMHLKIIGTEATYLIPLPESLRITKMQLSLADAAWSRDSTKILAIAHPPVLNMDALSEEDAHREGDFAIWEFSIPSGAARMLRRTAWAYSYSPNGSLISFGANRGNNGPREIWLMDSDGGNARKILDGGNEYGIDVFTWSPDGRRVSYIRHNESTFEELKLLWDADHVGAEVSRIPVKNLFGTKDVYDGVELPGGREIFSVKEQAPNGAGNCNLWTLRLNPKTGGPVGKAQQLTHLPGFCMSQISFSNDGKRIAFVEWANHSRGTIHVAELHSGGTQVSNMRHFTLTDSTDAPSDWTPDSKSLIFQSNRGGHNGIYSQTLDEDSPKLLVSDSIFQGEPSVSPDGKWLLYVQTPQSDTSGIPDELMRVPISGGPPQTLFLLPQEHGRPNCTTFPSGGCVIFVRSEDRKEIIASGFDPMKGQRRELIRIPLDPGINTWDATLSGDGTRIAIVAGSLPRIRVVSLRDQTAREFQVKDASWIINPRWAPDGEALFVGAETAGRYVLLRIDVNGRAQPVIANPESDVRLGLPSPDGRNLAIMSVTESQNVWMMENF